MYLYQRVIEAQVHSQQSRSKSADFARLSASLTLATAASFNLFSVIVLIQALRGPRIVDWMVIHPWSIAVSMGLLLGVHWILSGRVTPNDSSSTPLSFWRGYALLTLVLWIVAFACMLVSMRSAPI